MPLRWGIAALACLLIIAAVGCSTVTEKPSASVEDTAAQCEQLFRTLDTAVDRAGVRDGGTARIDGFPYLRANRFLASYRDEPMSRRQELWWIDRLKGLDTQARAIELANLPKQDRDQLDLSLLNTDDPSRGLIRCADQLVRRDLSEPKAIAGLFGVGLLRLDFGALYNKYHGETERNLRESLKMAEMMAPCVLWIDEIEKAFASAASRSTDGGRTWSDMEVIAEDGRFIGQAGHGTFVVRQPNYET